MLSQVLIIQFDLQLNLINQLLLAFVTFVACYCIATRFTNVIFFVDSNRTCFLNFYYSTVWFHLIIFVCVRFLLQVKFSKSDHFYFALFFRIFSLVYLILLSYVSPLFFFSLIVSLITCFLLIT